MEKKWQHGTLSGQPNDTHSTHRSNANCHNATLCGFFYSKFKFSLTAFGLARFKNPEQGQPKTDFLFIRNRLKKKEKNLKLNRSQE